MNVGIFNDTYTPTIDGTVTSVEMLYQELRRLNHNPIVIAPAYPAYQDKAEQQVIRIRSIKVPANPDYRIALPFSIFDYYRIKNFRLDVVHTQTPLPMPIATFAFLLAKRFKAPFFYTFHTLYSKYVEYITGGKIITPQRAERFIRITCNLSDGVVAPSPEMKDMLLSYGVRTRIKVIPTGINAKIFLSDDGSEVFIQHRLKRDIKVLLFAGRLCVQKNLLFLLRAFKRIAAHYPAVHLFLAGDGIQRKELEQFVLDQHIEHQVTFLGFLNRIELIKYYRAASVFVISSLTETQGLVILEAMLNDTPVVAVNAMGIPSTVTHGVDGFLTEKSDLEFAFKVLELLRNDTLREKMASNARKNAMGKSAEKMAAEIVNLYEDIKSSRKRKSSA